MNVKKALQLALILPQRPMEVWDRVSAVLEVKTDDTTVPEGAYVPITWPKLLGQLDARLDEIDECDDSASG